MAHRMYATTAAPHEMFSVSPTVEHLLKSLYDSRHGFSGKSVEILDCFVSGTVESIAEVIFGDGNSVMPSMGVWGGMIPVPQEH